MDPNHLEIPDPSWKGLYRAGGIAPLIALALIITQILVIAFGREPFPVTVPEWLRLFQRKSVLGLLYLNTLDILTISLLGPMFLALYKALNNIQKAYAMIAAYFALLGIALFVALRASALYVLNLTGQYAAAATDAERSLVVATGQSILLGNPVPQTVGFFFMTVAVLIFSVIMLRSGVFGRSGKIMAYTGILASALVFIDDASLVLLPSLSGILMIAAGGLWLIWWIMSSVKLLRLGRS
jgi:hypothetical protein